MSVPLALWRFKRWLPRRPHPRPFELLDALVLESSFKDKMRAFVFDLAEQLKGRTAPSSDPMILVRAPRGSGKTDLVRALTSALYRLGALRWERPFKINFSDLVAPYVGHSRPMALDRCRSALDGVLSIDDLYMLRSEWGQESLDTVRRFAIKNQRRIVVFFENTPWRAEQFFEACPHLVNAFGKIIEFPRLVPQQLRDVVKRLAADERIDLPDDFETLLMPVLERRFAERGWQGGREMELLVKTAVRLNRERVGKLPEDLIPRFESVDLANALTCIEARK